jgi:hypothetical protein
MEQQIAGKMQKILAERKRSDGNLSEIQQSNST